MRITRREILRGGFGTVGACMLPGAARSQTPASPPENPATLAQALPFLDWNPAERRTLLLVAPQWARLRGEGYMAFSDMPPKAKRVRVGAEQIVAGKRGFNLPRIAPEYGRKLLRTGAITAVVPETMAVLRYQNLPEPDLIAEVHPRDRAKLLLATLSPEQWRVLMTPEGLGAENLTPEQKPILAALLPAGTTVRRYAPVSPGVPVQPSKEVDIRGVNRDGLRLSLYQDLHWEYPVQGEPNQTRSFGDNPALGDSGGEPQLSVRFADPPATRAPRYDRAEGRNDVPESASFFGVNIVETKPNFAKASDLDGESATWDAPVAVADAATLGELLARVREATRRAVFADIRYASLPVYVRAVPGVRVRCGDLLRALAASVTGTYRRVGTATQEAFVLTDDLAGLGERLLAIREWTEAAQDKLAGVRQMLLAGGRGANIAQTAPWTPVDNRQPSPKLLETLAGQGKKRAPVPVGDLPPGAQAQIRDEVVLERERFSKITEPRQSPFGDGRFALDKPIREDVVYVSAERKLALTVPGVGRIGDFGEPLELSASSSGEQSPPVGDNAWYFNGQIPPDRTATVPVRVGAKRFTKRVLGMLVASESDARDAAKLAATHGFSALLLGVGEKDVGAVRGYIAAIHDAAPNLQVYLRTSLFRAASEVPNALLDRNLHGESWRESLRRGAAWGGFDYSVLEPGGAGGNADDYWAVGDPAATAAIEKRIVSLLDAAPTLAGIVLTDPLPPGYEGGESFRYRFDRELGYNSAVRLAFLKEAGLDPVDITPPVDRFRQNGVGGMEQGRSIIILPFFPAGGDRQWVDNGGGKSFDLDKTGAGFGDFRIRLLLQTRDALLEALRKKHPALPLFLQHTGVTSGIRPWLPGSPEEAKGDFNQPPPPSAGLTWLPFTFRRVAPVAVPFDTAERVARQFAGAFRWLDSPATTPEAKAFLAGGKVLLLDLTEATGAEAEQMLKQITFTL